MKESIDWEAEKAGSFSVLVHGEDFAGSLLFFFNARQEKREFNFPREPASSWELIADTEDPSLQGIHAKPQHIALLADRSLQVWKPV